MGFPDTTLYWKVAIGVMYVRLTPSCSNLSTITVLGACIDEKIVTLGQYMKYWVYLLYVSLKIFLSEFANILE